MVQVSDVDISIVIPVYHVPEELLLRCLKSIKSIRGLSREVLLVADGEDQKIRRRSGFSGLFSCKKT